MKTVRETIKKRFLSHNTVGVFLISTLLASGIYQATHKIPDKQLPALCASSSPPVLAETGGITIEECREPECKMMNVMRWVNGHTECSYELVC